LGAALCALVYYSPAFFIKPDKSSSAALLKTGGTSVTFVIMQNRWRAAYLKEKGVEVDYDSVGSTKGIAQMTEGNYAIAFTHAAVPEKRRKEIQNQGKEIVHVPVVLCAVVPVYNLKELKDKPPLKFSAEVLAKIFLGQINKWNDPELKKLNEGVDLPEAKITAVHRKDSSGTTFIFADYLAKASNTWRDKMGEARNAMEWPVGDAESRNEGLASRVRVTEGAIGYVDLLHAVNNKLPYGAVQNKDQTAFIHATPENMTAALKAMHADIPEDLTFKLTNQPGKDSYPISGTVWAVCYRTQPASLKKEVVDFLHWVTHEGQRFAPDMTYAPLPEELVERVDQKLKSIEAAP
jgi:phosphate transport system substrate-binding protein